MNYWNEKPYHSLDYEMKKRFGRKVYRLALNGGFSCPNRDGTLGTGGCIFCSEGGSGDFAGNPYESVHEQILSQKELLSSKRTAGCFIAYFQAYTNTYGPVSYLRELFEAAIAEPDVEVLAIGTRPDCLPPEVLELLGELNRIKPVWIELGLQTMHEDTARLIRRGYELPCFEEAVRELRARGIEVIVHTILGLPGEDHDRMLETMRWLNTQDIQGVKLQLLHVLEHTDLADLYRREPFHIMEMEEYIDLVIDCLEVLDPETVIHRVTGDGPKDLLIAPKWSGAKRTVLNTLHRRMKERGAYQGRICGT